MQLKLKVVGGRRDGSEIAVPGPKFLIGRDPDCQLRPRSDLISRHHCVLIVEQGYVGIRDFNSKNGTFVNGEAIHGERELKAGDELEIGPLHFMVHLETGLGGPKRAKVKDVKEAVARTAEMTDSDLAIDDWLGEEDEEVSQSDTRGLDTEDEAAAAKSIDETTEIRIADDTTEPPSTHTGKLPEDVRKQLEADAEQGPQHKDTQSAALDVLRQFRKQQLEKHQQKQDQAQDQEKKS
jgi:pSer/pThr/pTyr-binding forkhead associated (FHA) protein